MMVNKNLSKEALAKIKDLLMEQDELSINLNFI
jgi:hypothetical protein